MVASTVSPDWLEWVGALAGGETPASLTQRLDADKFACLIDAQPGMLVPRRFVKAVSMRRGVDQSAHAWNPHCVRCPPGEVPAGLHGRGEWSNGFDLAASTTAWVRSPLRGDWRPFWLSEELAERCAAVRTSGVEKVAFTDAERDALLSAGVLVPANQLEASEKSWEAKAVKACTRFRQRGYCEADGLIHPFHVGELRRYYRRMIRRGRVALGDYQSARRYVAHNEPVARFFHLQLTAAVTQLVGEAVKPSYVYFASYQSGAELRRHTDREQCEYSVTFCLDYAPEPVGPTPWPLQLDTSQGRVTIRQRLGDALVYRGRELPHSRERLPEGHTSTSIFFHYVRADFSGILS